MKLALPVLVTFALLVAPALADEKADVEAARAALMKMFDKPDNPLKVDPVAVSGDFGVADWTQGKMGGRALVVRKGDGWTIALCAGDSLRSTETLRKIGVPSADAIVITGKLAAGEKALAAERVAQLASFKGAVAMDAGALDVKAAE
jgi:hypothetical protein